MTRLIFPSNMPPRLQCRRLGHTGTDNLYYLNFPYIQNGKRTRFCVILLLNEQQERGHLLFWASPLFSILLQVNIIYNFSFHVFGYIYPSSFRAFRYMQFLYIIAFKTSWSFSCIEICRFDSVKSFETVQSF